MLTCATLTFLAFQLFLLLVKNPLHYSQVNVIQVYLAQLQFIYSFIYLFNCVCESFLIILCQFRQPAQNSCANCGLQRPFKSCENKVNVVVQCFCCLNILSIIPFTHVLQQFSRVWQIQNIVFESAVDYLDAVPNEINGSLCCHYSIYPLLIWYQTRESGSIIPFPSCFQTSSLTKIFNNLF